MKRILFTSLGVTLLFSMNILALETNEFEDQNAKRPILQDKDDKIIQDIKACKTNLDCDYYEYCKSGMCMIIPPLEVNFFKSNIDLASTQ